MGISFYNLEGYSDPVPFEAINSIEREERKANYRPLVYICSQFTGDEEGNTMKARKYSRFAIDNKAIPITPHLLFPQFIEETTERELVILMNIVLLGKCTELWVFGERVSEGMNSEIRKAKQKCMTIRYFTEELKEESR